MGLLPKKKREKCVFNHLVFSEAANASSTNKTGFGSGGGILEAGLGVAAVERHDLADRMMPASIPPVVIHTSVLIEALIKPPARRVKRLSRSLTAAPAEPVTEMSSDGRAFTFTSRSKPR
jgi:hypothetical protein